MSPVNLLPMFPFKPLCMPFLPAAGHAFAVNARSWHGVDAAPAHTKPRNSLLLTYYLGKTCG